MALITCPECGREKISDSADTCPVCGFKISDYFQRINIQKEDTLKRQQKINKIYDSISFPDEPSHNIGMIVIGVIFFVFGVCLFIFNAYSLKELKINIGSSALILMSLGIICLDSWDYKQSKNKYILAQKDFEAYRKKEAERLIELDNRKTWDNDTLASTQSRSYVPQYIISFIIPLAGIIIGAVFMGDNDESKRSAGKMCLVLGILSIVLSAIVFGVRMS